MYVQQSSETVKLAKALTKEREEKRKLLDENKCLRDTLEKQKLHHEKAYESQQISLKLAQEKIEELQRTLGDNVRSSQSHGKITIQKGATMTNTQDRGGNDHQIPIERAETSHMHHPKPRRSSRIHEEHIAKHQHQTRENKRRRSNDLNMTETLSVMFGIPVSSVGSY